MLRRKKNVYKLIKNKSRSINQQKATIESHKIKSRTLLFFAAIRGNFLAVALFFACHSNKFHPSLRPSRASSLSVIFVCLIYQLCLLLFVIHFSVSNWLFSSPSFHARISTLTCNRRRRRRKNFPSVSDVHIRKSIGENNKSLGASSTKENKLQAI